MTSRDRVINTLFHQISTPVPVTLIIPESVSAKSESLCSLLRARFQNDIELLDFSTPISEDPAADSTIDAWNCVWERNADGIWNYSEIPPYEDILELEGIRFPKNPVTQECLNSVNAFCASSSHFVAVNTRIQPFRRLCALGGLEASQELFRRKPRELKEIMSRLRDYYLKQLDLWCSTDADAIGFGDPLADLNGLRISIPRLNEFFFPLYQEFCQKIRACDKFVYFTGSGNFEEFISGLIYAGVDVLRYDSETLNALQLTERYANRVTFQPILKPDFLEENTEENISKRILEMRTIFENKTGVLGECQMSETVPLRKIADAMLNWRRRMPQTEEY